MRIAWLLRADLRQGAPAGAPISNWFKMWWLINAPREYPAWTDHIAMRDADLFRPLPGWPNNAGFGMSSALRFLLDVRKDLAVKFDVNTDTGLWDAIAWLFVHGIREHSLALALDENTLSALDSTPPFFAEGTNQPHDAFSITWLMFFVWKVSGELQAQFNLQFKQGRDAYLAWFLSVGVPELKLGQLLSPRWRQWLREPVLKTSAGAKVPRAAHLLWQRHQQLQQAFDIRTINGIAGLAMWTEEVWDSQAELSWIDQPEPRIDLCTPKIEKRPLGLNLIGFAFGELGIGEDVRMAVAACQEAGIPFSVVNISPGEHLRQADQALEAHVSKDEDLTNQAPYAINVFCLTAFDTARVALERGDSLFNGRYNIGWWPWELPVWPRDWLCIFNLVDEVWAATTFTYRMYTEAAMQSSNQPTPVTLMPMAVSVDRVKFMSRDDLDLPDGKFLYLYVFDFNSYLARKNPFAAVRAFRNAFISTDDSVRLVLKTMNSDPSNPEWKRFVQECAKDRRIIIMDRTLERGEVLGLIQACDVYLSLHRAEGFGRTLAEAMLFGKPVVGTDFSGTMDFLSQTNGFPVDWQRHQVTSDDYPFINNEDRAWWADPLLRSSKNQMRKARNRGPSDEVASNIQKQFSPNRIGQLLASYLTRHTNTLK